MAASSSSSVLKSVHFQVFGKVQGVFFRKHTKERADKYGLVGWVENTKHGTVVGVAQGAEHQVELMKVWLSKTGSPKSLIEKCEFSSEESVSRTKYKKFTIKR